MKKLFGLTAIALSLLIGWLAWFPVRAWMFQQIPPTAEWGGIARIALVILIGWGGGFTIPIVVFIGGIILLAGD